MFEKGDLVKFKAISASYFLINPDDLWIVIRENPDSKTLLLKNVVESDTEIVAFPYDLVPGRDN